VDSQSLCPDFDYDLENLFNSSHSQDEYLWQISLNHSTKYTDIVLHKFLLMGRQLENNVSSTLLNGMAEVQ